MSFCKYFTILTIFILFDNMNTIIFKGNAFMKTKVLDHKKYYETEKFIKSAFMLANNKNMDAFDCLKNNIIKNVIPFKNEQLAFASKILKIYEYSENQLEKLNDYIKEKSYQVEHFFDYKRMGISKEEQDNRFKKLYNTNIYLLEKKTRIAEKFIYDFIAKNVTVIEHNNNDDDDKKIFEILLTPFSEEQTNIYYSLLPKEESNNHEPNL